MAESVVAPRAVSVRALEEELREHWKSHAGEAAPGAAPAAPGAVTAAPPSRSALLTFITVVKGEAGAKEAAVLIGHLVEECPCRALIVELDPVPGPDGAISAFVSDHCRRLETGRRVCCEQLTIRSAPQGDVHLSSLVLPLLLPDLPVVLDWPEVAAMMAPAAVSAPAAGASHDLPRGAQFLCDLDPVVDLVILDSNRAGNSDAFLSRCAALAGRPAGPGMRPVDRNWARLLPWREGLADAVDHCRIDPAAIRTIAIGALAAPGTPAELSASGSPWPVRPRLLLGWFRDRLGDVPHLSLEPMSGDGPAGRIERVTLGLEDASSITVEREEDRLKVTRAGCEPFRLPRPTPSEEELLCRLIGERRSDPFYRRALLAVAAEGSGRTG